MRNTVQFWNIIQLVNYIRTFFFSYWVFQDWTEKKTNNKHCYNWQWTLLINRTPGGSFISMAWYASVPFSLYLQQKTNKKQTIKKQKTPNPVLPNCTIKYLKKGNVNTIFLSSTLSMFSSNIPVLKGHYFLKLENLGFHTIFGNEDNCSLRIVKWDCEDYFHYTANLLNFMGSI